MMKAIDHVLLTIGHFSTTMLVFVILLDIGGEPFDNSDFQVGASVVVLEWILFVLAAPLGMLLLSLDATVLPSPLRWMLLVLNSTIWGIGINYVLGRFRRRFITHTPKPNK